MPGFHLFDTYVHLPKAEQTWVIEDLLPTGGKLLVFSSPKVGKSWASLQLAASVAGSDDSWLGFPIHTKGPAFYLQLDTPRGLWVDEYLLPLQAFQGKNASVQKVHFADREEIPSYPFDIRYQAHREWLRLEVDKVKPVVVVVDVYREIFRGNENDSDTAQDVLSSLVGATFPAALVILSHVSKPSTDPDAMKRSLVDEVRGNTYLAGAVDGLLKVREKGFEYQSRTLPIARMKLERHASGLWLPTQPSTSDMSPLPLPPPS